MKTEEKRPLCQIIFIEEPEVHLHAPVQQTFISNIWGIIKKASVDAGEEYSDAEHSSDKGDRLADMFLNLHTNEIKPFVEFINDNTPLSTQHGVKGEEYKDVLVVFDDTEAAWNNYSFTKMLTPNTSGNPTEGQNERSRKLAYVCFSRAEENLRILLFTSDPTSAMAEMISKGLFEENQISIAN